MGNTVEPRYTSVKISDKRCEAQHFGADGLPQPCAEDRVFELCHSSGRCIHLCEYHVECYWNFWTSFRNAIREIWPTKIGMR